MSNPIASIIRNTDAKASGKAIATKIAGIVKRATTLQADIHITGLSCLVHAFAHSGDVTLLQRLFDGLPEGQRKLALKEWAVTFGPVRFDAKENKFRYAAKAVADKPEWLNDAADTPYYKLTKEKDPKPFDLNSAIMSLLKRAEKAAEDGADIDPSLKAGLAALAAKAEANKAVMATKAVVADNGEITTKLAA